MHAITSRLVHRRIANARAAARRTTRRHGARLQPKEPIFYGRNRREERRYAGMFRADELEIEREMLSAPDASRFNCREIWLRRRMDRLELSPRRMKALHQKMEAGAPRDTLGRAERRLFDLYAAQRCMEADDFLLRCAY